MRKLPFFFQEAFRALRRNAAPSGAAIVTIALTVTLLGVLIPALAATSGKTDEVRDQLAIKVFLFPDATGKDVKRVRGQLDGIPHVEGVEFISRKRALKILRGRLDDDTILEQIHGNPLPPSFNVTIDDPDNLEAVRTAIVPIGEGGKPQPINGVIEEVVDSRQQAEAIRAVTGALKIALAAVTALLLVASLLLIGNTIRLSIYARRREVEVMRLVGGTSWFIRWPFIIEGVVVGIAGAVLAIGVLGLAKVTLYDPLSDRFALVEAQEGNIEFGVLALVLIGAAMVVAAVGSGSTLRRFLRT